MSGVGATLCGARQLDGDESPGEAPSRPYGKWVHRQN